MSTILTTDIVTTLRWVLANADNVSSIRDTGNIIFSSRLPTGSESGQCNAVWGVSGVIGAGSGVTYDLTNLSREVLSGTLTVNFNTIKGIFINNVGSTSGYDLQVGGEDTTFYPWSPSGQFAELIPPSSTYVRTNNQYGWPVESGSESFNLYNNNAGAITYFIGIVGISGS